VIAVDTNVLARYLLVDDASQAGVATALLEDAGDRYWIPITVVLELAWLLRKRGVPRGTVIDRLRQLLALPAVRPQMPREIFAALRWAEAGLEVADALHLALSGEAARFATFDEELIAGARKLRTRPPVSAP
jgi:predicted nucleic acid-binding protein